MSTNLSTPIFQQLQGEQLSAVTFVQDYLQLWFDGPVINVTNPLTVQTPGMSITSWQPGFRDAICSQIAKTVASVEFVEGEEFVISFSDKSRLSVSLRKQDYSPTGEAIYAHGFRDNEWFVT